MNLYQSKLIYAVTAENERVSRFQPKTTSVDFIDKMPMKSI